MNFSPIILDNKVAAKVFNRVDTTFTQSREDVQYYSQHITIKNADESRSARFHATAGTNGSVLVTVILQKLEFTSQFGTQEYKDTKFHAFYTVAEAQAYFITKSKQFA